MAGFFHRILAVGSSWVESQFAVILKTATMPKLHCHNSTETTRCVIFRIIFAPNLQDKLHRDSPGAAHQSSKGYWEGKISLKETVQNNSEDYRKVA